MEAWLTVIVGVVGVAAVVSIPAALWAMVIYGLVQIMRENQQSQGPEQPRLT